MNKMKILTKKSISSATNNKLIPRPNNKLFDKTFLVNIYQKLILHNPNCPPISPIKSYILY